MGTKKHLTVINGLLTQAGSSDQATPDTVLPIQGDGSDRLFYRLSHLESPLIAVFPASESEKDLREARSCYLIGRHLHGRGVPVPEILAYDQESGALLFEDCGDLHLHDALCEKNDAGYTHRLYQGVIDGLILLQIEGRDGFDPGFCWDTPRYDMNLMLTRESDYFLSSFCRDYLGIVTLDPVLAVEFERLARRAARLPGDYLLHRDFQSRNILVQEEEIRIIDFQGARYGPLGYDIASLLIDPYAALTPERKAEFFDYYLAGIQKVQTIDQDAFRDGYYLLALQRNLQILGAFAYLSQIKGKKFFRDYINPALYTLYCHLLEARGNDYPRLRELLAELCSRAGVPV